MTDAVKTDKANDVIAKACIAICSAMPYVVPLAKKSSAKGDEAMAVMSRMMNALAAAKDVLGAGESTTEGELK